MKRRELFKGVRPKFEPHMASPGVSRFTNALLRTQDNKEVRFYDDLIRGKQCVINFMYAECHGACPLVTANLLRAYRALKDRMGRDLFFYSITVKPNDDSPSALKHYAMTRKADVPGWYFLTGDSFDIETIRFRLFGMNHPGFDLDSAMHAGTLRIINDATNTWTAVEAFASQKAVLKHISWADPPKSYAERFAESMVRQDLIEKDMRKYGYRRDI